MIYSKKIIGMTLKTVEYSIARIQQEPEVAMYFNVHVRGSYVVEEGQLFYVGQQGGGSTFNCLVNRARTETDSYNFFKKNKHTLNLSVTVSILQVMFSQGETPDPSDICSGSRYH